MDRNICKYNKNKYNVNLKIAKMVESWRNYYDDDDNNIKNI